MKTHGGLLLLVVAGTQLGQAHTTHLAARQEMTIDVADSPSVTNTTVTLPTITLPKTTPVEIPTVTLPQNTPTPTPSPTATPVPTATSAPPRRHPVRRHPRKRARARAHHHPPKKAVKAVQETWIWAYLTSYCPGSAGFISSSGLPVFYGMLANDYYAFGTRVYLPVLGITGVVEDRSADYAMWNHFDVWSPICYGTPTGWYKVAVLAP